MSAPYKTRELTELDLEIYLNSIQKKIDKYKADELIRPDSYHLDQIKQLDALAVEALARYYNQ